jgi:TonB family protein
LAPAASSWAQEASDPHYPSMALEQGVGGRVTLECLAAEDGRLACQVIDETPAYWGFGDAALQVSTRWRIAARTHTGQPTAGGRLRRILVFQPGPPGRVLHETPRRD